MKIAYLGNFQPTHSTETHLAKTLETMGHEVVRVQEDPRITEAETYMQHIKGADLFLWTRTWSSEPMDDVLKKCKKLNIPTVSYHLDLYVGLKRDGGIDTDPFWKTDFVFTPDGDPNSAEVFKAKGINHFYLRPGVFEEECYIPEVAPAHKLIFVGSYNYHPEWPYRAKLIDWLKKTYGRQFELWGATEDRKVRGDDLNRLYASSRIVVGDSLVLNFTHENYWSDRVYETIGRGGFLIMPYIKGLEEEFTDGENIVFYEFNNFKQLQEKIQYYDAHPEERERIRLAGHKFVKENATYTNRLQEMFSVIEGKK